MSEEEKPENLLTVEEAMSYLRVSRATLYRFMKDGLAPTKVGGGTRFTRQQLNEYLALTAAKLNEEAVFDVPPICSRSSIKEMVDLAAEIKRRLKGTIVLDLRKCDFFTPTGITFLCSIIDDVVKRKMFVRLRNAEKSEVKDFLNSIGFCDYYRLATQTTELKEIQPRVQLRRLLNMDLKLTDELVEIIKGLIRISDGVAGILGTAHNELIENVMTHSLSRQGCLVCAQTYPVSKLLRLTVLDEGQGIRASLAESYPKITSDIEAIKMSVQKGIGARQGEDRGLGLQHLLRFVRENRGELTIISGVGKVVFKSDTEEAEELSSPWEGTIVEVRLNQDQNKYYKLSSEEDVF